MEALVAMGVLSIGLTMVAAIFPTAILLQKEAAQDARRQINVRSAEAILQAKTLDAQVLFDFTEDAATRARLARTGVRDLEFDVYALAEVDDDLNDLHTPDMRVGSYNPAGSYLNRWPQVDRCFPSYLPDPATREVYSVPLFRRGRQGTPYINDWPVYLFVMRRNHNASGKGYYTNQPNDPTGNLTACANPFDDADYFPKVFRMAVDDAVDNRLDVGVGGNLQVFPDNSTGLRVRAGDTILVDVPIIGGGDIIYRVTSADSRYIRVNQDLRQDMDSTLWADPEQKFGDIKAIWFAMPPTDAAGSPVRDIRVLSQSTVQTIAGLN